MAQMQRVQALLEQMPGERIWVVEQDAEDTVGSLVGHLVEALQTDMEGTADMVP